MRHLVLKHLNLAADWISPVDNFNSLVGMTMLDWEPDRARLKLDIRPEHANGIGSVHGGVLLTVLDTVCGFAGLYTPEDEEPRSCATITLNAKFIKPAITGTLVAEARSQGGGRKVFFTHGEIRDEQGDLVATGDGSFRYRTLPPDVLAKLRRAAEQE